MADDRRRDALLAEISEYEALIARLEGDRERARERLAARSATDAPLDRPHATSDRLRGGSPTTRRATSRMSC